ncbi:MAG: hypothetical protein WAW06_11690 [bacterium]
MRWLVVGILVGIMLITGCAVSYNVPSRATGPTGQTAAPPDVVVESWQSIDAADLNARIDQAVAAGAAWPSSPLRITVELFGADIDTRSVTLKEEKNRGEGADTTVVTMVRDGFLDDSVRGEWHQITYRRLPDRTWRIHEIRLAYRCWRGHHTETFSSSLCL